MRGGRALALALCMAAFALPAAAAREHLGAAQLQSGKLAGPVPFAAFAPGADAMAPRHVVSGRLHFSGKVRSRTHVADPDYLDRGELRQARTLPTDLVLDLVQDGEHVIPAVRGPLPGSHPWWQYLFEPGLAWSEPGDGGRTRVALPFALVQRNANCTHNGMLSFLVGDEGVSQVALQVGSETCQYLQLDLWGLLPATFTPGDVPGRAGIVAAAAQERAGVLQTRPLDALADEHAGVSVPAFAIGADAARTRHGLVVDGVHYTSGCSTRFGLYPACDRLTVPSFSLAKTVVAGLAVMRLEALYPGLSAQPVATLSEGSGCRTQAWSGVRVLDLLDMATGHYGDPAYLADEGAPAVGAFFAARTHADKLAFACEAYPRREPPGQRWVYHTSDTYLLGSVLDRALAMRTGRASADVFSEVLVPEIYAPLGLSQTARVSRRTEDGAAQPFFGWGLYLRADDIAKLADFLGRRRGGPGAGPLLDAGLFEEAMQRVPLKRGLQVAHLQRFRYQHGLWARDVGELLGCRQSLWVPFLSGFGGITVALFPNDVAWYSIADDGQLASIDFAGPAREIHRLRPLCGAAGRTAG